MKDWNERCTIGITTRDRAEDLRHTIECQKAIGLGEMRYIIIDDGSADSESIRSIAAQLPRCRFIRHEASSGYVQRRQEMAEMCGTEFLISLDDDSYFKNLEGMGKAIAAFDFNLNLALVSFNIIELRLHEKPVCRRITQLPEGYFYWFRGCGYVVRVRDFLAAGGFPAVFLFGSEELHLNHQFFRLGLKVLHMPSVVVEHRWSPGARPPWERAYNLYRSQVLLKMFDHPWLPTLVGVVKLTLWDSWGTRDPFRARFLAGLSGIRLGLQQRSKFKQLSWSQYVAFRREQRRAQIPERVEFESCGGGQSKDCCTALA